MGQEISLIAATVYGNRGAEAMLCTAIGALRDQYPTLHAHVFSYYPTDDRARVDASHVTVHSATPLSVLLKLVPLATLFGILRLVCGRSVLRLAPASIRALSSSSVLVDLAGVSFIPGREKFLAYNVLTLLPAMMLGTPVVKMPQAMGPFDSRVNRLAAQLILPRCRKVWARGEQTLAHLQHSGMRDVRYARGDDLAFNYLARYSLSDEEPASFRQAMQRVASRRSSFRGVIGLCPSSVVGVSAQRSGVPYEPLMVDIIKALVDDGFFLILFPNATRDESGDKQRNNDLPLVRRLHQACVDQQELRVDAIEAFDMDINTAAIKQVIASLDVGLVSRFHAMVGALSLAVPVIVLGWSHKYREVMAMFGQEERVLDYEHSSTVALHGQVVDAFDERDTIREAIERALPKIKASALKPVLSLLGGDE